VDWIVELFGGFWELVMNKFDNFPSYESLVEKELAISHQFPNPNRVSTKEDSLVGTQYRVLNNDLSSSEILVIPRPIPE